MIFSELSGNLDIFPATILFTPIYTFEDGKVFAMAVSALKYTFIKRELFLQYQLQIRYISGEIESKFFRIYHLSFDFFTFADQLPCSGV